jgi:hypothetical protein
MSSSSTTTPAWPRGDAEIVQSNLPAEVMGRTDVVGRLQCTERDRDVGGQGRTEDDAAVSVKSGRHVGRNHSCRTGDARRDVVTGEANAKDGVDHDVVAFENVGPLIQRELVDVGASTSQFPSGGHAVGAVETGSFENGDAGTVSRVDEKRHGPSDG